MQLSKGFGPNINFLVCVIFFFHSKKYIMAYLGYLADNCFQGWMHFFAGFFEPVFSWITPVFCETIKLCTESNGTQFQPNWQSWNPCRVLIFEIESRMSCKKLVIFFQILHKLPIYLYLIGAEVSKWKVIICRPQ